ncbi:glutamate-ammonia-ligase adenylyltransferase [Thermodesulfobacteriota bacterium]
MQPTFEEFRQACPDVDETLIKDHLSRLGKQYFKRFTKSDLFRHIKGVATLSYEHPVEVQIRYKRDDTVDCTVFAFDYAYVFSLITGIFSGMGFNILSGDVFTYQKSSDTNQQRVVSQHNRIGAHRDISKRRKIIDHFSGTIESPLSNTNWIEQFRRRLEEIIQLLEDGDEDSIKKAKDLVSEWVIRRFSPVNDSISPILSPIQIEMDKGEKGSSNRLKVVSEDSPAFLYTLSNALSLQGIFIENVRIRTIRGRVEDQMDLVDSKGNAIQDEDIINRIKLATLFTKQFTYFLKMAPDPYGALSRFEQMLGDILRQPDSMQWLQIITKADTMSDLARLLGASDFLWEDFIRLQYETLLPLFNSDSGENRFSMPIETLENRLDETLTESVSMEEKKIKLNGFKDREIFLIDLDHILNRDVDCRMLSKRLTRLAELVIDRSAKLIYDNLTSRYGIPRSVAGIPSKYAILGMGKLGGAALGYASDIEVLFVYSDNGQTDGEIVIENSEFFSRHARETSQFIMAKREGIFQIDLRLRPYGESGSLASSFENFCRYYGKDGQSHSFERLALVRLRAVGGDKRFGHRIERIRDEIVYQSQDIDINELRTLREKQLHEKTRPGTSNAKFSPGGLVDLEYTVQILQVMHGKEIESLRTPLIHKALKALVEAGVMVSGEGARLLDAYDFLRKLINGVRMLRGSAEDLFLPPEDSHEFAHLARRMGYTGGGGLEAAQQLYVDWETYTAVIRAFADKHFGQESIVDSASATVVDLIVSDSLNNEIGRRILTKAGFKDPDRARVNLEKLAGKGPKRDIFARLALLAIDMLGRRADPDRALNNWERYIHIQASPEFHYNLLLSQPMRLEILLSIFSESQFMSDTLVRNPGFIDWVMISEILHRVRRRKDMVEELRNTFHLCSSHDECLNKLRRFRRKEILRIGIRDISLAVSTRIIMEELSIVADSIVETVLEKIWEEIEVSDKIPLEKENLQDRFCILAFGKLGGQELNYSSDIDLLGIWNDENLSEKGDSSYYHELKKVFFRVMERVRSDLSNHTKEGYAYRVDLRLRPFGKSGELVPTLSGLLEYYSSKASIWEIQAVLKLRPIAGNLRRGYEFMERLRPFLLSIRDKKLIVESIEKLRNEAVSKSADGIGARLDIKNGVGGIRDIEFLVQGLQLIHASENEFLVDGNTLYSIGLLQDSNILPDPIAEQLKEDYLFLRRTENYLQILDDQQTHALPTNENELGVLAKRIIGIEASPALFMERINECLERVREAYNRYLIEQA